MKKEYSMKKKRSMANFGLPFKAKRGNVVMDGFMILLLLLIMGFIIVIMNYVGDDLNADIQSDTDLHNDSKKHMQDKMSSYAEFWDDAFILMFILFWALAVISSFMIDSHPIFFIISIILLIFLLSVAMILGNSYEEFIQDGDFVGYRSDYPMMNYVLTHLLETIIVIGGSILIAMYVKTR